MSINKKILAVVLSTAMVAAPVLQIGQCFAANETAISQVVNVSDKKLVKKVSEKDKSKLQKIVTKKEIKKEATEQKPAKVKKSFWSKTKKTLIVLTTLAGTGLLAWVAATKGKKAADNLASWAREIYEGFKAAKTANTKSEAKDKKINEWFEKNYCNENEKPDEKLDLALVSGDFKNNDTQNIIFPGQGGPENVCTKPEINIEKINKYSENDVCTQGELDKDKQERANQYINVLKQGNSENVSTNPKINIEKTDTKIKKSEPAWYIKAAELGFKCDAFYKKYGRIIRPVVGLLIWLAHKKISEISQRKMQAEHNEQIDQLNADKENLGAKVNKQESQINQLNLENQNLGEKVNSLLSQVKKLTQQVFEKTAQIEILEHNEKIDEDIYKTLDCLAEKNIKENAKLKQELQQYIEREAQINALLESSSDAD